MSLKGVRGMSEIRWTWAQQSAINSRGNVLVSAAAGSGKTAVLVERVMRMIAGECDIDRLLIVTFTRAAAAQMKEKISAAIAQKLAEDPANAHWQKQQILLEKAQITTIDSFCADVVKNNFQQLEGIDIAMNYRNLDSAELSVLSAEVMEEVLEEFYDSGDDDFLALMDVFTSGKNDVKIYDVISLLHNYTGAFTSRFKWIKEKINIYKELDINKSPWGQLLESCALENLTLALLYIEKALDTVAPDEPTDEIYGSIFREDKALINSAFEYLKAGEWDSFYRLKGSKFQSYSTKKKGIDELLRAKAKVYRDAATSAFYSALSFAVESEEEFADDNKLIYPTARQLEKVYCAYENRLFEKKIERQSFEFADIALLALMILADPEGGATSTGKDYQKKYKGILVDEYQDTNDVQDLIFETISDNNLFIVGDVKQSIYRFRQAMPQIFIGRREALEPYSDDKNEGYILLKNNFRSQKPVTDFVNFIFKKIMSKKLGDVDYNEDEYLIPGAAADDNAPAPELHILENINSAEKKISSSYYESSYIAELIKSKVKEEKLCFSDFCVLVRSKTHIKELEQAFSDCDLPFASAAGEKLFETPEIMLVMSFLRAIDNPLRDVDLIAVMYSEIFGFTAEELALLRLENRKGSIYSAALSLAGKGNRKCEEFISKLETYRTLSATLNPADFLRRLYEMSSLPEIMSAGENGALKKANLFKFISVVELYSGGGYFGLTGLVRFLEKVKQSNPDIPEAYVPESDDKVKIMTVHASKGLEFPVVIFAFSNNLNNHYGSNIVLNRDLGIGIKAKDLADNTRYNTIAYQAVSEGNIRADVAEELRTLYVALTRAKTQLIITGTYTGKAGAKESARFKKINSIAELSCINGKINSAWMRLNNNFLSWLIACALLHPDCGELRKYSLADDFDIDFEQSGHLKVFLPEYTVGEAEEKIKQRTAKADAALKAKIKQNFDFKYQYAGIENIDGKQTPSALAEQNFSMPDYSFEPPAFMLKEKLTAAQRGTATHRFMEKVRSFENFDYQNELSYMLNRGFLSPEQAEVIDKNAVKGFFKTKLAKRMASAEKLVKEYEISYLEEAGFFDETLPDNLKNEKVFVDGMIDAAFVEGGEAVIVDYKTDRVKSASELCERYSKQMQLYKRALESVWGIKVKECHIYSFVLGEDISVNF